MSGKSRAFFRASSARQEGRFAIVTKRWAEDAVDAVMREDEAHQCGRRSRGVLIPRRWYQACGDRRRRRRQQARLSGETTKETVKTIRAGNAGMFRRTCGDLLVCFFHLHARLRVRLSTRHSLRPLFSGRTILQNPDVSRRGKVAVCHDVIAMTTGGAGRGKSALSSHRYPLPLTARLWCDAQKRRNVRE
jgi:hypothetical protein